MGYSYRFFAAFLAGLVSFSWSTAEGLDGQKFALESSRTTGSLDRVEAALEVSGEVHVLNEGSELKKLKLAVKDRLAMLARRPAFGR